MRYKLIKIHGCQTSEEVLIQIQRDGEEGDCVQISAWHKYEGDDYIQSITVEFDGDNEGVMMERFVCDFSEASANAFANSMTF